MAARCPKCGETRARHLVGRPEYDPVAPQLLGGVIGALVFALSRKRRFRCDACGELFYSHTMGSRIWLTLWTAFWVLVALFVLGSLIQAVSR